MRIQQIKKELPKRPETKEIFLPQIKAEKLPSKFLPYPKDSTVHFRGYTFGELMEFNDVKRSVAEEARFMMQGVTTSFPIEELAFGDYFYLSLARKIITFGNKDFSVPYYCDKCGKDSTHVGLLSELDLYELNAPALPITVEINGRDVKFSSLTFGKWLDLVESENKKGIKFFSALITNMDSKEAEAFLSNIIDRNDLDVLDMVDEELFCGVKPLIFKCRNKVKAEEEDGKEKEQECGNDISVKVSSPEVLLRPFPPNKESLRSRIRFG